MQLQLIKCAFCQGTGRHPHYRSACPVCKGTGRNRATGEFLACSDCRGSGRKSGTTLTCYTCGGKGVVPDIRRDLREAWAEISAVRAQMERERTR